MVVHRVLRQPAVYRANRRQTRHTRSARRRVQDAQRHRLDLVQQALRQALETVLSGTVLGDELNIEHVEFNGRFDYLDHAAESFQQAAHVVERVHNSSFRREGRVSSGGIFGEESRHGSRGTTQSAQIQRCK